MESITFFFSNLHNLNELIRWGGYIGLIAIIFAETGLFFGFFLPGDSLLVTAGLFAARGDLNIFFLLIILIASAVLGDATGFEIGRVSGKKLLQKKKSRFFKPEHIEKTEAFYKKHGGKTILIARFMPIVRTFAPLVAGIAGMKYRTFALFNIGGGVLWISSMLGIGFFLGRVIPNIDKYIHIVIAVVIFLSILPGIISYLRSGHWRKWIWKTVKVENGGEEKKD
ncbi:MAG: VTT domain-containing protein [bacterium]|nr:VTT domain-containing protein [bacterium]